MVIICNTVLILPLQPAATTRPFSMAIRRRPSTISSRMTTITGSHTGSICSEDRKIIIVTVRILSAMGSANLPKFVISLFLRAILPSKKSVTHASANTAADQTNCPA